MMIPRLSLTAILVALVIILTSQEARCQQSSNTAVLMNLHPIGTQKFWRYLFQSDCNRLRTAIFDKRSPFRNVPYDGRRSKQQLRQKLQLHYMCNEKFDWRAFGACRSTCRFVRRLKRMKNTTGYDVCDPHQQPKQLSMF